MCKVLSTGSKGRTGIVVLSGVSMNALGLCVAWISDMVTVCIAYLGRSQIHLVLSPPRNELFDS